MILIAAGALAGCNSQHKILGTQNPRTVAPATIVVQSPAFQNGQPIPRRFTTDEDMSPPLRWSNLPDDTRSVAILLEDPDVEGFSPYCHWVVYNIAPSVMNLPENRPHDEKLRAPFECSQGLNSRGTIGYFHPDPPRGDKPHRYYFEVFAVDRVIPNQKNPPTRDDLLKLLDGHVLAKGELMGTCAHPAGE